MRWEGQASTVGGSIRMARKDPFKQQDEVSLMPPLGREEGPVDGSTSAED